jgi:hypothetical protein
LLDMRAAGALLALRSAFDSLDGNGRFKAPGWD